MVDHNSKLVTRKATLFSKHTFMLLKNTVCSVASIGTFFSPALECTHRQNLVLFGKAVYSDFNKVIMAQAMRSQ